MIILFVVPPKFCISIVLNFSCGDCIKVPREVENKAYAKFWRDYKEYYHDIFEKGLLYLPCYLFQLLRFRPVIIMLHPVWLQFLRFELMRVNSWRCSDLYLRPGSVVHVKNSHIWFQIWIAVWLSRWTATEMPHISICLVLPPSRFKTFFSTEKKMDIPWPFSSNAQLNLKNTKAKRICRKFSRWGLRL